MNPFVGQTAHIKEKWAINGDRYLEARRDESRTL